MALFTVIQVTGKAKIRMRTTLLLAVFALLSTSLAFSQRQAKIVAAVALSNQTGTTGGALYTPTLAGLFRVNFYVQCTKPGSDQQLDNGLSPSLKWTDDNSTERINFPAQDDAVPQPPTSHILMIKDLASAPIQWQVSVQSGDVSVYEVYIVLEEF